MHLKGELAMIFVNPELNITPEEVASMKKDYLAFVGEAHMATCSQRGWDYAAILSNAKFKPSDIVLDIGCAASYFIVYLARFVAEAYGIDDIDNGGFDYVTKPWLETLNDYIDYNSGKVKIVNQNAASLPFPDNFFDHVVTVSALEHFKGLDDTLCAKEIYRVLKPGANFMGTVDFNPVTEHPQPGLDCRTYTYEAFIRRILEPSGLKLKGPDLVKDMPIPASVEYIAAALGFHLVKESVEYIASDLGFHMVKEVD